MPKNTNEQQNKEGLAKDKEIVRELAGMTLKGSPEQIQKMESGRKNLMAHALLDALRGYPEPKVLITIKMSGERKKVLDTIDSLISAVPSENVNLKPVESGAIISFQL
jgi:hypothetical protein